eukprot:snap_masked-scaffold_14-processed-gene-9.19-mRNA-1 protein AED:1.00 eAED:1.00 QI:0/0/0/0/1/1/3/0/126
MIQLEPIFVPGAEILLKIHQYPRGYQRSLSIKPNLLNTKLEGILNPPRSIVKPIFLSEEFIQIPPNSEKILDELIWFPKQLPSQFIDAEIAPRLVRQEILFSKILNVFHLSDSTWCRDSPRPVRKP